MQTILLALLPIFLLILLGYFFKRINFPNEEFWQYADKFTYFILFPSLLLYKLSTASLDNIDGLSFISSMVVATLMVTIILMIINKFAFFFKEDAFTSVFQGSVRFNTYVFLALISAILGDDGLVLASLLIAFMIPILNFLCISVFAIYTPSNKVTIISFLKSVFTNPLIIACAIGGGMNLLGIRFFTPIENTLSVLSSAALPLGLLSVGVGLHIAHIKEVKLELFSSMFLKLIVLPVVAFFCGLSFGLSQLEILILVIFASMPTAPTSYVLARQLGGDLKLMSAIISLQTIVSIVTISLFLMILENYIP